jgi:hypothetical protein
MLVDMAHAKLAGALLGRHRAIQGGSGHLEVQPEDRIA